MQHALIWNEVWKKRVIYYASVIVLLGLASFPLMNLVQTACMFPHYKVGNIISFIGLLLPGFVSPWVTAFSP